MLTIAQKRHIVEYVLPIGSFCDGIKENPEVLGGAYETGEVTEDDIYDFLEACRDVLITRLNEEEIATDSERANVSS